MGYGHLQLKYFISQRNWDTIVSFCKKNQGIYDDFVKFLRPVGFTMPDNVNELNFDVIDQSVFDLLLGIVKDTNIKEAFNEEYWNWIQNHFKENPQYADSLLEKAATGGLVFPPEPMDEDAILKAMGDAFLPNVASFIPTIVNIAVYAQAQQIFG